MKWTAILLSCSMLSGCAYLQKLVPADKPKWPEVPPELMKRCEDLKTVIGDKVTITDMLSTVVNNYTLHYQCANRVDGWQKWYEHQKSSYEMNKK